MQMRPTRTYRQLPDGRYEVAIVPPDWSGFKGSLLVLTADQFERYQRWVNGEGQIQEMFPEFSPAVREQLLSGIPPEEWDRAFGNDE